MPENWAPPYPAWSAPIATLSAAATIAHIGVQSRTGDTDPTIAEIRTLLDRSGGASWVDHARFTDGQGYRNQVLIGYWKDPQDFAAWAENGAFAEWWTDPARDDGDVGLYLEAMQPTPDRLETLHSSPEFMAGSAHLTEELTGPIEEHGYWGGMRDRIPRSASDPLDGRDIACEPLTAGGRIRVAGQPNLCMIRSGQDWTGCKGEERERYLSQVHPNLIAGMGFLAEQGSEVGCHCCRLMTELDPNDRERERTFGLAFFRSLEELERWAKSHPTHLAIFDNFVAMATDLAEPPDLRLWHEVAVIEATGQRFEYVNCHPRTGLLPLTRSASA